MLLSITDSLLALLTDLSQEVVLVGCLVILICWRTSKAIQQYFNRPRNMIISGKTLLFGQWLSALDFIYQGADRIADTYRKVGKSPFAILALSNYQVLVSSQEDIQELAQAPEDIMSFRKAMNERLFFKYTMGGFTPNHVDPNNSIPNRVFKILARENLPNLSAPLAKRIAEVCNEFAENGKKSEGSSKVALHALSGSLIARMNNQLLFGEEFAKSPNFEKESIRYGWHSSIAMEIFRQIPAILIPFVAKLFMTWSGAMHRVGPAVQSLVRGRLENRQDGSRKEHLDCTYWVISSSHTREQSHPTRIAQQMMALLFASTHQMQMALTWAIVELCLHPQYIKPLRAEIQSTFASVTKDPYEKLYLMESFLRESSRLNPLDSLNVQRKTLKPFIFSNGSHVPAGNLVAIPQREMMRDPSHFDSPEIFNPYRFMQSLADDSQATTKYTDVNWTYTFWGSPRLSCPGRWYASYALKHVLVHLLTTYDFELLRPEAPKSFIWTTAIVPKSDMQILLSRRTAGGAVST